MDEKTVDSNVELVKYQQEGMPSLELLLEDETFWITQKQMSELFDCAMENIIHHLKNIYLEGELDEPATTKEYLVVRIEGKRSVSRKNREPIGFHP